MFQDKADPILSIRRGLAADEEAGDVVGGGGGPISPEDETAGQGKDLAETPVNEASSEGAPGEEAVEEKPEPNTDESAAEDDQAQFEAALDEFAAQEDASDVDYSKTFQSLREGDVVEGTVVHIDREGVLVDVGTKSEGIIRMGELTRDSFQNPEDVVSVGERIAVYVLQTENSDGNLLLSKKRADFEVAWERVQEAHKTGKIMNAMVSDRVKGGLVVDLGIRGFVPASHVGSGRVKNLDKYVGQSLPLKVIEVDRERRKVVLSHRLAVEEEREKKREETLENLAEGQVRPGVVRRITDYGAFVDLGGIDGLLHISEMSWTRINNPADVVKVGQKIQVMVLKLNRETGRVSLGMRQILPDPWQELGGRYKVGEVISGKISRLVPFGAFVQLEEGIEAIIPNQELSLRRVKRPDQVVSVGQEVEVKILEVRPEERRMTLSMRALMTERDFVPPPPPPGPQQSGREAPRTTVADLLGDAFAEQRAELERSMSKAKARARKKAKDRAIERDEEEAFDGLSDDDLLAGIDAGEESVNDVDTADVETEETAGGDASAADAEETAGGDAPAADAEGSADE